MKICCSSLLTIFPIPYTIELPSGARIIRVHYHASAPRCPTRSVVFHRAQHYES